VTLSVCEVSEGGLERGPPCHALVAYQRLSEILLPYRTLPLAFFLRAFAAAFEAVVATRRRSSAVIFFRRAFPPRRPISERYLEMGDSLILPL